MNFTYEMEPLHIKINFSYEIFDFTDGIETTHPILFSYVKLSVKFLERCNQTRDETKLETTFRTKGL